MNSRSTSSDFNLVHLAQQGDLEAYNTLLERHHHKIKQIVYFYVNDHAYTNDLVQEVLLKIFRHLSEFKNDCEFTTWIYRIVQNTIKNYFRALNLRIDSEAQFANEQSFTVCTSPEHQLMNMELGDLVESAVAKLSEDLRLCYGMHIFEGQTYETIAQRMHCPIGTVRSRIFRARKLVMGYVDEKENNL
ncbi:sigma-70 family RNA polymerase sigma factor [Legionella sp. km772]|uniref:sigma-70 family RNA polymerase sigma factor n=1 Tax=Legionella sp. km772 TaxID=2498111 RepID=UPI000F8DB4DF|nr:sigma-70 family RNA polymerase sigma factor [Legionella sp. km772]RUR13191.1 sigma-70 family RNA polymerase sigma factor [Legionella sp. km772]